MMMRSSVVLLLSLLMLACSGRNVPLDDLGLDTGLDAGTSETSDAALIDSGTTPTLGHRPSSCGKKATRKTRSGSQTRGPPVYVDHLPNFESRSFLQHV